MSDMRKLINLIESIQTEQLDEGAADKLKGAIIGAAITFAAVNTDLDKIFVEPIIGAIEQFKATDKPTTNTVAVVNPDTKEVKRVEPKVKPTSTERVDYYMKEMMDDDPKVLGYVIKGDALIIKVDGSSMQKGWNAYQASLKSGIQKDNSKDIYQYWGYTDSNSKSILKQLDKEHSLFGAKSGIKKVRYSMTDIDSLSKEVEKEKFLTRPGDKGEYKIVSTKSWNKDPNVTIILSMRINADRTKTYTVRGIDVWNKLEYGIPAGKQNSSDDYSVMKNIYNSNIELGPGVAFNPRDNTIQAMMRSALIRTNRDSKAKDTTPKKDTASVKAYKDAISSRSGADTDTDTTIGADNTNRLNNLVSKVTDRYDSIQRFSVDEDTNIVKIYFISPYEKGSSRDKRYIENTLFKIQTTLEREKDIKTVKFYRIKAR